MSFSGPITISQGGRYRLDSYGNGAAYAFWDQTTGRSVWLQGDDAEAFRAAFDRVEELRPIDEPDQIMAHLWDEHDYGAAATVFECENQGFKLEPRAEFEAYGELSGTGNAEHDAAETAKLKARVAGLDGDFVLYDPADDSDGFLLVGDDAGELDRLWLADYKA